jgi:hypothetical protein
VGVGVSVIPGVDVINGVAVGPGVNPGGVAVGPGVGATGQTILKSASELSIGRKISNTALDGAAKFLLKVKLSVDPLEYGVAAVNPAAISCVLYEPSPLKPFV